MPGIFATGTSGRKRKEIADGAAKALKPRKAPKPSPNDEDVQLQIVSLEADILESRAHYNNIVKLQELANRIEKTPKTAVLAAVSLCRVFCRLISGNSLLPKKTDTDDETQIVQWLRDRLKDYVESVSGWFGSPDGALESTALTLLMRIVKEETTQGSRRSEAAWRAQNGTFMTLMRRLLLVKQADLAREEFVAKFVEEYDDVRFFTFLALKQILAEEPVDSTLRTQNAINILSQVEGVPESDDQLEDWYGDLGESKQLKSLNGHRKVAQEAWLGVFQSQLARDQRKVILNKVSSQILPWFTNRVELLVDLLTDSFNEGGSLALLALSGIFFLMTERNLDYPDFYPKLYSLLDEDIMHSKHRSRFFRLLEKFMASTHLPAAMVASFIKRLSRLSLEAPPGAIVFVVPWIYNMLKQHPACTFMIHRTYHPAHSIYQSHPQYQDEGMDDPFDMLQKDPVQTNAIDSSLWELHTLQLHYHPNVATLAKIISEQFTKRDYRLEDFLDHSYATLLDGELSRTLKKAPVVEWEIPKRIITLQEGDGAQLNNMGKLLEQAIGS